MCLGILGVKKWLKTRAGTLGIVFLFPKQTLGSTSTFAQIVEVIKKKRWEWPKTCKKFFGEKWVFKKNFF